MKEIKHRQSKLANMYAHRGFHSEPDYPENSMPAFRRAIENGFAIEMDLHLTADGQLVVFHDDDLERMTGTQGIIDSRTLRELKQLKLGSTEEKIPTFDEFLELCETLPRPDGTIAPLLIELKVVNGNYRELVKAVCSRLDSYTGPYAIQSFDPRAVIQLRRSRPNITRGQLSKNFMTKPEDVAAFMLPVLTDMWLNVLAKPDFISYKFRDRDNRRLRYLVDKKGIREACWTIRTPQAYMAAVEAGCIPIFEGFDPGNMMRKREH